MSRHVIPCSIESDNFIEVNRAIERLIAEIKMTNPEQGINIHHVELQNGPDELVEE